MLYEKKRKRSTEENPRVFLDVSVDKKYIGTMVFQLFVDVAPTYAENFRALCTGERGVGPITDQTLCYENSYFLNLEKPCSYVKGGDFFSPAGICGESIYGKDFKYLHVTRGGLLCMNIGDQYTLGSHFVITLQPDQSLDSLHVVFGKLIKGFETLEKIASTKRGSRVQVSRCGEYDGDDTEEVLINARETTTETPKLLVSLDVDLYMSIERMVFELFPEEAPLASENFRALCTGEKGRSPKSGKVLCYMNKCFHKKRGSSYVTGGTLHYRTDEGVESIYGPNFRVVETNGLKHDSGGLLSISKRDLKASCGSFIITLRADPKLDRSHIVFGKLLKGLEILEDLVDRCSMCKTKIVDSGIYHPGMDIPVDVIASPLWSLNMGGAEQDGEFRKELECW